jgi:2-polyprenyl-3-methyl-5-hydroxy-6-metoxy-1,4-benzoquinol methylase
MQVNSDPTQAAPRPVSAICPVCCAEEFSAVHRTPEQRILRCRRCTVVYGWPIYSESELLDYTEEAYRGEGVEETAGLFDRCRGGEAEGPLHREYRRALRRIGDVVPGGRLLDVGCGIGTFLHLAQQAGFEVEGIDPMAEACRIAREDFGLAIRQGTFSERSFRGEIFDVVTLWDFLEHVPDPASTLHLAHRLLRPGGAIFVCVPNHHSVLYGVASALARLPVRGLRTRIDKLYHFSHVTLWTPRSLGHALAAAGFRARGRGTDGPDLGRYRLPAPVRLALASIDLAGRVTRRRSRLWMLGETA